MSYLFDGVDDRLSVASVPASAVPLSIACWFKTSDSTTGQTLVALSNGTAAERFGMFAQGAVAGDPVRALTTHNPTNGIADSTTGYSTGSWQHACNVYASATDRRAFVNGGSKGTNATSLTPTGLNLTEIGRHVSTLPMNGRIAEVAVWNVALSDADVAALAAGADPATFTPAPVACWHLLADANDSIGTRHLTVSGATLDADHPFGGGALTHSVNDTATVTDTPGVLSHTKTLADSLAVTDGGAEQSITSRVDDTATVTDQVTLPGTQSWTQNVNDTVSVTDAQARVWHAARALSDTAALGDGVVLPGAHRWEMDAETRWPAVAAV